MGDGARWEGENYLGGSNCPSYEREQQFEQHADLPSAQPWELEGEHRPQCQVLGASTLDRGPTSTVLQVVLGAKYLEEKHTLYKDAKIFSCEEMMR